MATVCSDVHISHVQDCSGTGVVGHRGADQPKLAIMIMIISGWHKPQSFGGMEQYLVKQGLAVMAVSIVDGLPGLLGIR